MPIIPEVQDAIGYLARLALVKGPKDEPFWDKFDCLSEEGASVLNAMPEIAIALGLAPATPIDLPWEELEIEAICPS
jgi:hypothetical protein